MDLKKDFEEIKKNIDSENIDNQAEVTNNNQQLQNIPEQPVNNAPTTFEDAKNKALAEFKPTYDTSKSMYENGKDIARTIAVSEALKDDDFINEMKEGAQENIRTDMDTDQKKAEIENQNAFYKKHKPVLMFARMKEPCDLSLMKWAYGFAVVPYILSLIVGGGFSLIAMFFESINALFNSIMGIPEYLTDKNGELIKDNQGNFVTKNVKVNLLTKIVFWALFAFMCLVIIFAVIKAFTGFDIIQSIKTLVNG